MWHTHINLGSERTTGWHQPAEEAVILIDGGAMTQAQRLQLSK